MVFPKVLFGAGVLVAGIYLPPWTAPVHAPAHGTVGMQHEAFTTKQITIHRGQTLTFTNDSRWIHIIGPGNDAHLSTPGNAPVSPRVLLERNQTYTSGVWNTPGTYLMTCTVHPEMNLKVVVQK